MTRPTELEDLAEAVRILVRYDYLDLAKQVIEQIKTRQKADSIHE